MSANNMYFSQFIYFPPWFLICKNITYLSKWTLLCQIKLEVDQILCWSNVWSCETRVKLSEEEMGGCPFSPLHRTVVSRKSKMEGVSEGLTLQPAAATQLRDLSHSPQGLCSVVLPWRPISSSQTGASDSESEREMQRKKWLVESSGKAVVPPH